MEVIPLIRAIIPSTIEIRQDIFTESDIISADQTQIHQVVLNLCSNAAYAMRDRGGVLEISLKDEIITAEDCGVHPEMKPGPHIRLIVSDTGCGIEPEMLDRIFDPFFTTKASGEGTGLGLSVVHGIIRSHGGAITVCSKPGQGSSFHVIIPKIVSDVALERKEITRTPRGEGQILVVDDEDLLTEMSRQRLERLGYSVVGKTDSIEALEIFRADPDRFDLVVTDYTMPNMTGFDLSKEILHIRPNVPIIMCSGSHEPVPREKIEEIGIRDFFQKPIGNDDFARLVQDVLDKSRQRDIRKDG
jgi:CheY-like chemotaxis protein